MVPFDWAMEYRKGNSGENGKKMGLSGDAGQNVPVWEVWFSVYKVMGSH